MPPLPQVSAVADAGGKRDTRRRLKSWLDNRLKSKKGWVSSRALSLHGVQEQKLGKQQIFTLANQWKEIVYMTCTRCLGHVGRVIIAYLLIVRGHCHLLLVSIKINFSFGNKIIIIWIIFKTLIAQTLLEESAFPYSRGWTDRIDAFILRAEALVSRNLYVQVKVYINVT